MATDTAGHRRHHAEHEHLSSPFGEDWFGKIAEGIARFFGTPVYLVSQTIIVVLWIAANAAIILDFDPFPFILLNLAFSLQAAYAAPLILLASTRQADRDKMWSDADARHREELAQNTLTLLQQNTELTQTVAELSSRVNQLTEDIHRHVVVERPAEGAPSI